MKKTLFFALTALFSVILFTACTKSSETGTLIVHARDSIGTKISNEFVSVYKSKEDEVADKFYRRTSSDVDGIATFTLLDPGTYYVTSSFTTLSGSKAIISGEGTVKVKETTTITIKP